MSHSGVVDLRSGVTLAVTVDDAASGAALLDRLRPTGVLDGGSGSDVARS